MSAAQSSSAVPRVGFFAGLAAVVILYTIRKIALVAGAEINRYTKLAFLLGGFLLAGYFVGRALRTAPEPGRAREAARGIGMLLVGAAVAVLAWTFVLEELVLKRLSAVYEDHGFFSVEIGALWAFGLLPALIGMYVGSSFSAQVKTE